MKRRRVARVGVDHKAAVDAIEKCLDAGRVKVVVQFFGIGRCRNGAAVLRVSKHMNGYGCKAWHKSRVRRI